MQKVLYVKFGWSDYYCGAPVVGNYKWLKQQKGTEDEGNGYEAFNFTPIDNEYYCYVPPQGAGHFPKNDSATGWTVVCLSKHPKEKGMHVVGWYENAVLIGAQERAPQIVSNSLILSAGKDRTYCIKSKTAYIVPPNLRNSPISDKSFGRAKYSFLSGPSVKTDHKKRLLLEMLLSEIKKSKHFAIKNPKFSDYEQQLEASNPFDAFGTPEHRKATEQAAEKFVIKYFENDGYKSKRRTSENCGYDFEFTKGKNIVRCEVKGTSGPDERFYITRNEYRNINIDGWKLAIVTNALSEKPKIHLYNDEDFDRKFAIEPLAYSATKKAKSSRE